MDSGLGRLGLSLLQTFTRGQEVVSDLCVLDALREVAHNRVLTENRSVRCASFDGNPLAEVDHFSS
jgi:hypothetical protein